MNISFNGINESIITFKSQGDIKPGNLVTVCDNDTVKKSDENENFIGVCISCSNGLAAVQIAGYTVIKIKNMKSTTFGLQYFTADSDSSLKLAEPTEPKAKPINVVNINKEASLIGAFL